MTLFLTFPSLWWVAGDHQHEIHQHEIHQHEIHQHEMRQNEIEDAK